jgi:hypothetical protein
MLRERVLRILTAGLVPCMAGCAVGPNFKPPAAPIEARYSQKPLASRTNSNAAAFGASQDFVTGKEVPQNGGSYFVHET